MYKSQLEHAIRAASSIVNQREVLIIGSQAILGSWNEYELPPEATMSIEVDIAPISDDDAESLSTLLDGALGEDSLFHQTHGFYVQGVGKETAILPQGWESRLVPVVNNNTRYAVGLCLDPLDLCAAKLAANREKDHRFVKSLIDSSLVDPKELKERILILPEGAQKDSAIKYISGFFGRGIH